MARNARRSKIDLDESVKDVQREMAGVDRSLAAVQAAQRVPEGVCVIDVSRCPTLIRMAEAEMTVRESIEAALRSGPLMPYRYAMLVYWLSQEDWVQLCLDFA